MLSQSLIQILVRTNAKMVRQHLNADHHLTLYAHMYIHTYITAWFYCAKSPHNGVRWHQDTACTHISGQMNDYHFTPGTNKAAPTQTYICSQVLQYMSTAISIHTYICRYGCMLKGKSWWELGSIL